MSYSITAGQGAGGGAGAGRGTGPEARWENGPGGRLRVTPGRVAALVLGVPVALAMIGWTSFNIVALLGQASYPVNVTIQPDQNRITAKISGDVTLRQSQVSAAQLTGTARYSLFKPAVTVKQTAGSTNVDYDCHALAGNCSLDGTLVVPTGTDVSLSTLGSDMTVPDFTGNLSLSTEGGTLAAGTLTGNLQLRTLGGDLDASSLVERGSNTLQINSSGGTVNADSIVASSSQIQSVGGDVNATFTQVPHHVVIRSSGGTVSLVVPHGDYQIFTSADGGTADVGPQSDPNAHDSIEVYSTGGDIHISYGR